MENEQQKPTSEIDSESQVYSTPPGTNEEPLPNVPTEETVPLLSPVPFYKNKGFLIRLAIVVIVIVGGIYYAYTNSIFTPAVAEVNGMKITQVAYDESVSLIEQNASLQGINLSDIGAEAAIKAQALDILINNALLITAAEKHGITVSQAEIDEKYNELVENLGGVETLDTRMAEVGLTAEKLKSNIEERILADKYVEAVTDIEAVQVSDEEINDFYNQLSASGSTELPPLEGIRTEITTQLRAQKQQEIIETTLETLKNEADIVINI